MDFSRFLTTYSFQQPDKIAITDDAKSVTYFQLNSRVNSLPHGLARTRWPNKS